ncbi:MAG: PD40 domain-containing protein [Candidatus Cloacimonetes bacterium]|nr:PD40 domain-containing protein [Candidatus Cloacimonadota bacterium]
MPFRDFFTKKIRRVNQKKPEDTPKPSSRIVFSRVGFISPKGIMQVNTNDKGLTSLLDWGEDARVSPNGMKIIFSAYPHTSEHELLNSQGIYNFSPEIHIMDVYGTNIQRLTLSEEMGSSFPRFSPDGTKIGFKRNKEGKSQIWIMDIDGKNIKQLTHEGHHSYFCWMPNGKIAFQREYEWTYTMDLNGINEKKLTIFEKDDYEPVWSPDGEKVAFGNGKELFIIESNGQNRRPITVLRGWIGNWSLDNCWLVFSSRKMNPNSAEIFIVREDGKYEQRLTENRPRQGKVSQDFDPCWLP